MKKKMNQLQIKLNKMIFNNKVTQKIKILKKRKIQNYIKLKLKRIQK